MCDKLKHEAEAKLLLDIAITTPAFVHFRKGARTRAVLALLDLIDHKFKDDCAHVTVKLYRGDGSTAGSKEYQRYHQTQFKQVAALRHPNIQRSLAGGVASGVGPYSIMQYVPGDELAPLLDKRNFEHGRSRIYYQPDPGRYMDSVVGCSASFQGLSCG